MHTIGSRRGRAARCGAAGGGLCGVWEGGCGVEGGVGGRGLELEGWGLRELRLRLGLVWLMLLLLLVLDGGIGDDGVLGVRRGLGGRRRCLLY